MAIIHNACEKGVESLKSPEVSTRMFQVEVIVGDIIFEEVDAIVNTTNGSFSFDGPLSEYIFNNAGNFLRGQTRVINEQIRISRAGILKCSHIFHVAVPHINDCEAMEDLVFKVLKTADQKKFESIAFPAIGAGFGGWRANEISISMQNAFQKFKTEWNHVELIRVVLSPAMSDDERSLFRENINNRYVTTVGLPHIISDDFTMRQRLKQWLRSR